MNTKINIISQIILYPFILLLIILVIYNGSNMAEKNASLTKDAVYGIIEKSVMQCYASEGSYPADLEYLEEHYGLILDRKSYIYEYNIFASNIMPEIIIHNNIRENIEDE